jgi:capsular polysaccharide export protein
MFELMQNRKLRKLFRNPAQFIRDSKAFKLFSSLSNTSPDYDEVPISIPQAPDDVILIEPLNEALSCFELIGKNWLDNVEVRPIAILWGFNPWKRRFMVDYLQEYRVAFARGRTSWRVQKKALDTLKDLHFVIWGMSETTEVKEYAVNRNIPLIRVEDGFIRSADLGSTHSLPLSLAIDCRGIYYDANRPSDLEYLLATHDFAANPKLMAAAKSLRQLYCDLKISKYNLGSFRSAFSILGPKIKERILVIGQVDDDASIRHGLAQGWTSHKLVELARHENPQAEIIYKPHPDVLQSYRSNSDELKNIEKICRVMSEDVVLADVFSVVDRVYAITSLSGLEALLHGLPVTLLGAPFYAGWGLTDDRIKVERRERLLTLDELFCGAYLLYPRYLTDPVDPVVGCMGAMLRVMAQRRQGLIKPLSAEWIDRRSSLLAQSDSWPLLFRKEHLEALKTKHGSKLLNLIPVPRILAGSADGEYKRSMAYFLVGKLRDSPVATKLIHQIRPCIQPSHFAELLTDLWAMAPSVALLDQWAEHSEGTGNTDAARIALEHLTAHDTVLPKPDGSLPIPSKRSAYVLKLAQYELRYRHLDAANKLFNHLLLSGFANGDVFSGLAEIARLRFNFDGAARLTSVFNTLEPDWKLGRAHLAQANAAALASRYREAVEALTLACFINPQYIESAGTTEYAVQRAVGDLPLGEALQAAVEVVSEGGVIPRAKALIVHERFADAENFLLGYSPTASELVKYCLTLSLAYSYQGKLSKAKLLIANLLPHHPTLLVYREALRLAVLMNEYAWGLKLLKQAEARGMEMGDMYQRKIRLGQGDLKGGYLSFRNMSRLKTLYAYLPNSYRQDFATLVCEPNDRVAILGFFGPGDEIRFASLYRDMRAKCPPKSEVTFTCDPRLLPLLERSYPDLNFLPVARVRSLAQIQEHGQFNRLPGADLHTFIDNAGWDLARQADRVTLTTDLLGELIDGYESFRGTPYLKADPIKVEGWRKRLEPFAARPLVGLSWRSSLTTYSRNEHYLSVEDLVPIFALEGVQFVNLQYDDCSEELKWIEDQFPGRLLNFEDLDQYNDLDGVAALMACMDVVVSPATTVVELSGALGCRTFLLSNSSELHWRKKPGTSTDAWHNSVTHVEGKRLGNKVDLISELIERLISDFIKSRNAKATSALDHVSLL